MLNQYTFLTSDINRDYISQYRDLLVVDYNETWWTDSEWTVPGIVEIRREINANWWVIVLNDSWKVIWGSYITELPEFQWFQMRELWNATVLISERQRWISTRVAEILLGKYSNAPLYSVVWETTSKWHTRIWHAILAPEQLWPYSREVLAKYWELDWQIILANEHANVLLTSS